MEFPHEYQTCLDIFDDLHLVLVAQKQPHRVASIRRESLTFVRGDDGVCTSCGS